MSQALPRRPGIITAAGVLGILQGTLLVLTAVVVIAVFAPRHQSGSQQLGISAPLTVVMSGVALAIGVLMIAGSVRVFAGRRLALVVASICSLLISGFWTIVLRDTSTSAELAGLSTVVIPYSILPVIILVFGLQPAKNGCKDAKETNPATWHW
jgi:hypothetical protein